MPKLVHGLVYFDICPDDRQNFKSLTKCMDIRARNAMRDFVPDSEATVFYLQLCSEIASSLMDHDVIPHQRIELIFHAVYFLRIWKKWIQLSSYNPKNFITINAYMCIEVNAVNLLKLVRRFRDEEKPELFLTTLFDSQACERAFRQFRAMGTQNFTKVNFTLFELLHMTRRYEVQNDILYTKLPNVQLPKLEKSREKTKMYALPSEEEIAQCLERAKRFALDDATRFGMQVGSDEIDECELTIPKKLINEEEDIENESYDDFELEDLIEYESDAQDYDELEISGNSESLQKGYLMVKDPRNPNKDILMRKSTFVWHLTEGTKKISSDRLHRVQDTAVSISVQQAAVENGTHDHSSVLHKKLNVSQYIKIGDWCFFKNNTNDSGEIICVGLVLAFKFAQGRTANEKRYKGDIVDLRENEMSWAKKLEVLSSWYLIDNRGHLIPAKNENHFFIKIENYVATVAQPMIDNDTKVLFFPEDDFKEMEIDILKSLNVP